jgi:predicted unusual protein kinase regulating ubiquinone biosynthesis (AarF/ABC1/UbiB family)
VSDAFARLDALVGVALRIARSAPSGRIALARLHELVDASWIPEPWRERLSSELAAAHAVSPAPLSAREVEDALRAAWAQRPSAVLQAFEPEPLAVSQAAQVHRARLDGRAVAVKLLRPGIAGSVRQDLALLESMLGPLGAAFEAIDPAALVREARERVLDELDLEHEAGTMRRFQRALRRVAELRVPAPVSDLCREQVLVCELIEGVPLADAPAGDERDRACALLVRFVLGGLRAGIVHCDPDPRDVLLVDDGIAVLDYGAAADVQRDRARSAADAVEGFLDGDERRFAAALEGLGALPPELAPAAARLLREALGEFGEPAPAHLDVRAVAGVLRRAERHPDPIAQLLARGSIQPADLWPGRAALQLFAAIAQVGATGAWPELTRAALREGW